MIALGNVDNLFLLLFIQVEFLTGKNFKWWSTLINFTT